MTGKFHIGKSGVPSPCRAKKKPCPYGGVNMHYSSMAEAQSVADDLNGQTQKLIESGKFGFATHGEHIMPTPDTEKAIIQVNNLKYQLIRMNAVYEKARADLLSSISSSPYGKFSNEAATVSVKMGHFKNSIDVDKLKEDGIYNDYLKDSNVSEFTTIGVDKEKYSEDYRKVKNFERRLSSYDGSTVDFGISIGEDGKVNCNEQTIEALKELKKFKDTLERAKELEKSARKNLLDAMKDSNVDAVNIGKATLKYVPQHTEKRVDTQRLKDEGLYEEYSKQISVPESILIRFK